MLQFSPATPDGPAVAFASTVTAWLTHVFGSASFGVANNGSDVERAVAVAHDAATAGHERYTQTTGTMPEWVASGRGE